MKPDTRSFYDLAVMRALQRVVHDLDDALDLDALAREANLSPFHFHRIFRGMVGETPVAMHRRLRLERAASTLQRNDAPVARIAFEAGFETHEAFTRAFRAAFGSTPSEFRAAGRTATGDCVRVQTELASRSGVHWTSGSTRSIAIPFIGETAGMDVSIVKQPRLRAAAVRHVGPYNRISEAFARLHAIAAPAGLLRPGAQMVGVYHDDPETVPENELRSDAAITVNDDATVPDALATLELPAGEYARATHLGPYELLGDAWAQLMGAWLPRSGRRIGQGLAYELYVNNPTNAKPDELRTELYLPLA